MRFLMQLKERGNDSRNTCLLSFGRLGFHENSYPRLTFRKTTGKWLAMSCPENSWIRETASVQRIFSSALSIYDSISVHKQNNDYFCFTNVNVCTHYFMPSKIKKQQRHAKSKMIHRNEIVIAFALCMCVCTAKGCMLFWYAVTIIKV